MTDNHLDRLCIKSCNQNFTLFIDFKPGSFRVNIAIIYLNNAISKNNSTYIMFSFRGQINGLGYYRGLPTLPEVSETPI